jgi:hypothetical protein
MVNAFANYSKNNYLYVLEYVCLFELAGMGNDVYGRCIQYSKAKLQRMRHNLHRRSSTTPQRVAQPLLVVPSFNLPSNYMNWIHAQASNLPAKSIKSEYTECAYKSAQIISQSIRKFLQKLANETKIIFHQTTGNVL